MTDDDLSAYEADAGAPDEGQLSAITRLAKELREAQAHVTECEEHLKNAQARAKLLEEVDLPAAMAAAGQTKCQTSDGYEVELGETLRAGISQERMPQAALWLNANGFGSIIKREVKADFGKGEDQKAAEAVDLLRGAGFAPTDKMSVHAMTLQSAVKEMMERGLEVPMDLLGVHIQPRVRVKEVKKARGR